MPETDIIEEQELEQEPMQLQGDILAYRAIDLVLEWIERCIDAANARNEILEAIETVKRAPLPQQAKPKIRIRVLPSLPRYRYVYTCPRCRCHVMSNSVIYGGGTMSCCAWCGHLERVEGWWQ